MSSPYRYGNGHPYNPVMTMEGGCEKLWAVATGKTRDNIESETSNADSKHSR